MIWFGSSDKSNRFRKGIRVEENGPAGIAHGIGSGQWEQHAKLTITGNADTENENGSGLASEQVNAREEDEGEFLQVGSSSSIGMDPVPSVTVRYSHDDPLTRFRPRLQLRDLNDCMFMPVLSRSLAEKLHSIQVFANGYKLADIGPDHLEIDHSSFEMTVPGDFTPEELADRWVRIRPSTGSSTFQLRFTSTTPRRMYAHDETRDSPAPNVI